MNEKWIGIENNPSGSYHPTECPELQLRKGGYLDAIKLYRFTTRFGQEYNITDEEVIAKIESLLENYEPLQMYNYLYGLVIEKFSPMEFVLHLEHFVTKERDKGYRKGEEQLQNDFRKLLGL